MTAGPSPRKTVVRLDLSFPADLARVPDALEQASAVVTQLYSADTRDMIQLALQEALTNAVVHGSAEDASLTVHFRIEQDTDSVLFTVSDSGRGFDPATLPDPRTEDRMREPRGRGIFMIHRLMDEVEFRHGGSEIRMRKRRA